MVNNGTNAATVISAEKKIALSTCSALAKIRRSRSVQPPVHRARRISAQSALRELLQQALSASRRRLEIPENVLDQDHRRIDDDAEIDGADRQQVGVLSHQHHDDDGEEQRERDVGADDDGAAQVAEENPLDAERPAGIRR